MMMVYQGGISVDEIGLGVSNLGNCLLCDLGHGAGNEQWFSTP